MELTDRQRERQTDRQTDRDSETEKKSKGGGGVIYKSVSYVAAVFIFY